MLRVGLTGGLAAGKSVVAQRLRERGVAVIDADALARQMVEPGTTGLAAVVAAFGPEVVTADGALDRARLAEVVFGDELARRRLEAIIHPLVQLAADDEASRAEAAGAELVVYDIPLLVESGQAQAFDLVVTVWAPAEVRLARAVAQRGLSPAAARARLAAQVSDGERQAIADVVLDGSRSVENLRGAVDRLIDHDLACLRRRSER